MTNLMGWAGGLLLALCGAPQAIQSLEQGHSLGISPLFISMWGAGELCCMYYVYKTRSKLDWPLLINYILNLTFIMIIGYYML